MSHPSPWNRQDVLYVPDLDRNFVSISQAKEKGIDAIFLKGGQRVIFQKDDHILADDYRESKLYRNNLKPVNIAHLNNPTSIKVWDERLGHVNFETLRKLSNNKIVKGLDVDTKYLRSKSVL
ncbi:uncharacterized protein LOC118732337 [Rhagoletis pomonella]|uniref:uncharacterized protein LOC118732337 n=1 Tax=Rhagoletis pomonella TaxID=28610 RepID=UPI00177BC142|nr:uncharacterized protein LOC118732337 [Rhagoletis pomonella]